MSSEGAGLPPDLEGMLARFEPGCPAYLAVGPGWYGLLAGLDAELSAIEPSYTLRQVKEKFGGLRFYFSLPPLLPACCLEREVSDPRPSPALVGALPAAGAEEWWGRESEHLRSDAHASASAALESSGEWSRRAEVGRRFAATVAAAEARSLRVCDVCAAPGLRRDGRGWVSTRCDAHAS